MLKKPAYYADNIGVFKNIMSPLSAAFVRKYGRLCFQRMQKNIDASVCGVCRKLWSPLFEASRKFLTKKNIFEFLHLHFKTSL